jgi:hypothetical protein
MGRIIARAAAVGRSRMLAGVSIAALAVAFGAAAASAASKPGLSLKANHTIVAYRTASKLSGRLSNGKKGVLVKLQDRVWPFKGRFKTVAKAHTRAHGDFSFSQRPSLATKYRAVAPKDHAKSATRTVYVVKGFKLIRCVITGHGHTYPGCGSKIKHVPAGHYTWTYSIEFFYPAGVFGKEKDKPVYTYFAENGRADKPPKMLKRQKNVRQHSHAKSETMFKFAKRVMLPNHAWYLAGNFCTKTTEQTDGFGLPGAPGSHMCGAKAISSKLSPDGLA